VVTHFATLQRLRGDISDAAQTAVQSGQGNKARLLGQVIRELDTSMEAASAGYQQANRNFAQASTNIDAIADGTNAARRGRSEDIIPAFRGLTPQGQTGYRAGYVDPLIEQAQGSAMGVNKARPLMNDAFSMESAAIAPQRTQPQMMRRIGREDTMFKTRFEAMGGSKTYDNFQDGDAMGADMSLIANVVQGNWGGALRSAVNSMSNGWTGNTAGVREEVARVLMQNGQNVNPVVMQQMLDDVVRRIELVTQMARQMGRGAAAGVAVTPSATGARR
jgi:hypothetical protein